MITEKKNDHFFFLKVTEIVIMKQNDLENLGNHNKQYAMS